MMRALPNWVVWRLWHRDGSAIKVPIDPRTEEAARTNNPTTWRGYDEAYQRYIESGWKYKGLGFILGDGNGLFGIDLDGCVHGNTLAPWACSILDRFHTYVEISPSGTGIKMYGIGDVPTGIRLKAKIDAPNLTGKTPGLEVYGRNRFFAFTTKRINWHTQIHDCSDPLDKLLRRMQPKTEEPIKQPRKNKKEVTDHTVQKARNWLIAHGPAVSGQFGHTHTYTAALALMDGFGLSEQSTLELLMEWNLTCRPPWSQRDLVRKIEQAKKR